MQDIINNPEYPWDWEVIFSNDFLLDKELYVTNQIGRLLIISMLDEYNSCNDFDFEGCNKLLNNTVLLLYNDYQLSCILPYI